jgi:hypothetical protein
VFWSLNIVIILQQLATRIMATTIKFSEDALFQMVNGEVVILDLAKELYFGLNEVGSRIWMLLQDGKSLEEAREMLLAEYDVEPSRLESDIEDLLKELSENGLATVE